MSELAQPTIIRHEVVFQRNTDTGAYRARCICGWCAYLRTLLECQLQASTHDLWENVK
jgi:hypothetical protein